MSITVRAARPDELARAGEICVAAYHADGRVRPGNGYAIELADAASRVQDGELLVAVDGDGALLGTVTVCRPDSRLAEISRPGELEFRMLAVDPSARGRGVGEALVRAVLDRARAVGADRVVLCSVPDMHVARRIYLRLGFRRLPDRDWRSSTSERVFHAYGYDLA